MPLYCEIKFREIKQNQLNREKLFNEICFFRYKDYKNKIFFSQNNTPENALIQLPPPLPLYVSFISQRKTDFSCYFLVILGYLVIIKYTNFMEHLQITSA